MDKYLVVAVVFVFLSSCCEGNESEHFDISESAIEMQPKRLSHFGVYLAISLAVYLAVSFYFYVYSQSRPGAVLDYGFIRQQQL